MGMSYSIDFVHRVTGRTLEEAYQTALEWLQSQKAEVKATRAPTHIEAWHGRAFQIMGWRKDAKKTLSFDFEPAGPDVLVTVRITPAFGNATDVQMHEGQARANWNELHAELWVQFGEEDAIEEAIRRPPVDWDASLRRGRSAIVGGLVLSVLGVGVTVAFLSSSLPYVMVPTGLFAVSVLAILYGAMLIWQARRGLARQVGP